MDSHFGQLDAKMIGQDFSIHAESLANAGIDSAVLWNYQEKDADKLKQIGIPTVMINNDSVDTLKKSFLIVGQMLGKRIGQNSSMRTMIMRIVKSQLTRQR